MCRNFEFVFSQVVVVVPLDLEEVLALSINNSNNNVNAVEIIIFWGLLYWQLSSFNGPTVFLLLLLLPFETFENETKEIKKESTVDSIKVIWTYVGLIRSIVWISFRHLTMSRFGRMNRVPLKTKVEQSRTHAITKAMAIIQILLSLVHGSFAIFCSK